MVSLSNHEGLRGTIEFNLVRNGLGAGQGFSRPSASCRPCRTRTITTSPAAIVK